MINIYRFILLMVSIISITNPSLTQWVQTNGPYGGNIFALVAAPNGAGGTNLFAGTNGDGRMGPGIFLSTDNGESWDTVNSGLTNYNFHALAAVPDGEGGAILFAGTEGGAFRSTDNGGNWTPIDNGLVDTSWYGSIWAFAINDSFLFAATRYGVYRSSDNGTNWIAANIGLEHGDIYKLVTSPRKTGGANLFAGVQYRGVFLSTDNGSSWSAVNAGLPDSDIASLAVSPNVSGGSILFAATKFGHIYRSTDDGASWSADIAGWPSILNIRIGVVGTTLFACPGGQGIYRSTDNGESWTQTGLTSGYIINFIGTDTNLFAGTFGGGVYRSTDDGISWVAVSTGLSKPLVLSLVDCPNGAGGTTLVAGTYGGGLYRSTDGGANWIPSGFSGSCIYSLAVSPDGKGGADLFAGGDHGLFRSTDCGINWTIILPDSFPEGINSLAVYRDSTDNEKIIVGGYRAYLSTDNGTSWTQIAGSFNGPFQAVSIIPDGMSGTNLLISCPFFPKKSTFISTDNGISWDTVELLPRRTSTFAISPNSTGGKTVYAGGVGMYFSTDYGMNWSDINRGFSIVNSIAISIDSIGAGPILYIGGSRGVFISNENGASWTAIDSGLTTKDIRSIAISGSYLFAGTGNAGVLKWPLSQSQNYLPLRLYAMCSNEEVILDWTKKPDVDFSRYRILGDTVPHGINAVDSTTGGINDTTTTVHGLSNGKTYYFRVATVDQSGFDKDYSNEVSAIPGDYNNPLNMHWCMVSVPTIVHNYRRSALFPFAISHAFSYEGTYVDKDTLANGIGYWIKYGGEKSILMGGNLCTQETINVREGWNMIGSISTPVAVTQVTSIPGSMETSQFFGYSDQYFTADTIYPAKGYWVKVNQDCSLILSSSVAGLSKSSASRIRIVPISEHPPTPPDGKAVTVEIPKQYMLEESYPNPFNPTATIKYQLPEDSRVTMKMYNVLGQVVRILVDEIQPAGFKSVSWDAAGEASGIYFYKMDAVSIAEPSKSFTKVKKMVLLK